MSKQEGGLRIKMLFNRKYREGNLLISVITVVKNGGKYLEQTIQSVTNQSYDNIEYIIIDGESTDGTLDLLKKYEHKISYWVSEPDNGIYDAMNKGVKLSSGEYIYFLNSGDTFYNNMVFSDLIKLMDSKLFTFVYGNINLSAQDGNFSIIKGKKIKLKELIYGMVCHQALLVKKEVFTNIGFFNTKLKVAADYEWTIKLFKSHESHSNYFNITIANMPMGGISDILAVKGINERRIIVKKYFGIKNFIWYYIFSLFYEIPRNKIRIFLTNFGLIEQWRKVKKCGTNLVSFLWKKGN